ncbi:MAG: nuclear transport factor 2 family protein [Candidatus Binatia bacterium]
MDERAVASFLARFFRFGAEPDVATYMPLFHPDVVLFDDGMERPIGYDEIPASITATLALAQGFRMVPERWRHHDGVVFVEARNEATILGAPCRWQSVYRVRLDGDRVIDGRRYYDRAPLLATFDPTTPRLPSLAVAGDAACAAPVEPVACLAEGVTARELLAMLEDGWRDGAWHALAAVFRDDATWHAPGVEGALSREAIPAYRTRFARLLGGAPPRLVATAGDDTLVLTEWRADVPTPSGGSYALGMIERFDLVAGRVLAARTYLDAAALAQAVAAQSPDPARS